MKLTALITLILCIGLTASAGNPTEKVLDAFRKSFPLVSEVSWSENSNTFYAAFKQNDIQIRVNYDKKGNIISILRYYHAGNLPLMILATINKNFTDKKIFGVVEQSSSNGTLYFITLEGADDWTKLVGNTYGDVMVEQILKKA